jgi:hypothetical protein
MAKKLTLKKKAPVKAAAKPRSAAAQPQRSAKAKRKASLPARTSKPPVKKAVAPVKKSAPPPAKPAPRAEARVATAPTAPDPSIETAIAPPLSITRPAPTGTALNVSAQASPGAAQSGNTQPANLLVIVTCNGWPVVDLSKDHFTIMEHFEVPAQSAPFSNNIVSFRNAGTGAYLLQVKPINQAPWRAGHHLGQILISTPQDWQGQTAFKLIVR